MESVNERLIELVRAKECLYNKQARGYKNVLLKTKIWEEIGQALGITADECAKKWKSLRDRFTRELKKTQALTQETGTASQQFEDSQWEHFESLSFLSGYNVPRQTISNTAQENNTVQEIIIEEDTEAERSNSSCSSTAPSRTAKKRCLNDINAAFMEVSTAFKQALSQNQKTEDDKFGQTVALLISEIRDPQLKAKSKAHILQYLANLNAEQYE